MAQGILPPSTHLKRITMLHDRVRVNKSTIERVFEKGEGDTDGTLRRCLANAGSYQMVLHTMTQFFKLPEPITIFLASV
ncbi:hypothetical protein GGP41_005827 [Bipolaris sorokiniana]|uniref:Uncharacterized protein n=1 Tax=Cochliobolus sativus TaxID=45130 RepID=A0A8H5ZIK8_COCSA|nr:hypothetical protein GGP41_005827 [Bipolaris sorokiniana]